MILTETDRQFLGDLAKIVMKWPSKGYSEQAQTEVDDLLHQYTDKEAADRARSFPK